MGRGWVAPGVQTTDDRRHGVAVDPPHPTRPGTKYPVGTPPHSDPTAPDGAMSILGPKGYLIGPMWPHVVTMAPWGPMLYKLI